MLVNIFFTTMYTVKAGKKMLVSLKNVLDEAVNFFNLITSLKYMTFHFCEWQTGERSFLLHTERLP